MQFYHTNEMIIKCVKCKVDFNQFNQERRCIDCRATKKDDYYNELRSQLKRTFQDPIHEWFKEFVTTEPMPSNIKAITNHFGYALKGWT